MSRLEHLDVTNCVYFITTCTDKREMIFSNTVYAKVVEDAILYAGNHGWCHLLGYVIMPDHLHLAVIPHERKVPLIMQGIKGFSARQINSLRNQKRKIWQRGYRDFVMDNKKAIYHKLRYIEENPVRAGLVNSPADYPFSSANKRKDMDIEKLL